MQWIDSHAHLTGQNYQGSVDQVLERSRQAGVTGWITIATTLSDAEDAVRLAASIPGMFAAAGIHPHEAVQYAPEWLSLLKHLCENEKVCAIGEIGLDYHYDFSPRSVQRDAFRQQLELADRIQRPVVIHCREAFDDCIAILDEWGNAEGRILFHCFGGDFSAAKQVLDRGGYLSFAGTLTFKKADSIQHAARYAPLERILLETDCPYLSPEPKRNIRPNEPALLVHTGAKLAELRNLPLHVIAQATTENCRTFFHLPPSSMK